MATTTLGDRIRELRLDHPVYKSLRQFAADLGKSPSWVSKVERNLEKPSRATLMEIARRLDADADELMQLAARLEPEVETAIAQRFAEVSGLLRTLPFLTPDQIKELEERARHLRAQSSEPNQRPPQEDDLLMTNPSVFAARHLNVPWMNDTDIAASASRLRWDFQQGTGASFPPVSPEAIIWDFLDSRDRLSLDTETPLGFNEQGLPIAGKMVVTEDEGGIIRIDPQIANSVLYPFTLAHEIGHWILHRRLVLQARQQLALFGEFPSETVTLTRSLQGSRGKLPPEEWQANRFAAHLLMPAELLREEFLKRFREPLCYENWHDGNKSAKTLFSDVNAFATHLASKSFRQGSDETPALTTTFSVSKAAMAIQLEELGLVTATAPALERLL